MRISIITLHRVLNYGSVLQAFATSEIFKSFGCQVEFVDYVRSNDLNRSKIANFNEFKLKQNNKSNLRGIMKWLYKIMIKTLIYPTTRKFFESCERFINLNMKMSNIQYNSLEEINSNPPQADIYCTGSDQVWNSYYNNGIDSAYFLSYSLQGKKISLSSSFGNEKLDELQKDAIYSYLKDYIALSVRENSGLDILNSMGLEGEKLIDPTLMLDLNKWTSYCEKRIIKPQYLLVYNFENSKEIKEIAVEIAREKKLKIVSIGFHQHHRLLRKGKVIIIPSINEFLTLLYYADFVVTNSFHGTCFSLNFRKEFAVVLRNQFNTRMQSILNIVELEDRIVNKDDYKKVFEKTIDFDKVDEILGKERKKAINYIEYCLSTCALTDKEGVAYA